MPQVKVWNENVHPFKQRFLDEEIEIPAKSFIKMEEKKAIQFKSSYSPIEVDHDGKPTEKSFKMIRLEPIDLTVAKDEGPHKYACMACGDDKFQTQKALDSHIEAKHAEQWADKDFVEKKAKDK